MFDQMFRRQERAAIDRYQQDLYAKFRTLGANVDKLKRLGLATPQLEHLLRRLESVHDKSLVRFITDIAHLPAEKKAYTSRNMLKTCPRCTRKLTGTNVTKDHYSDDLTSFIVICECGYVKEIKNSTTGLEVRQSTLYEYPCSIRRRQYSGETEPSSVTLSGKSLC
jgi:hypothetical protein